MSTYSSIIIGPVVFVFSVSTLLGIRLQPCTMTQNESVRLNSLWSVSSLLVRHLVLQQRLSPESCGIWLIWLTDTALFSNLANSMPPPELYPTPLHRDGEILHLSGKGCRPNPQALWWTKKLSRLDSMLPVDVSSCSVVDSPLPHLPRMMGWISSVLEPEGPLAR